MAERSIGHHQESGSFFESRRALILALVVGGVLRFAMINRTGLEPDELHSLFLATEPTISAMFTNHLSESNNPHPTAHYIFHWFWVRLAGTSEIALRIPSFVMGMLTIYFVWRLGEALFDRRVAGSSALWTAMASSMISVSVQARMYAQLILLSTIFMDIIVRHFISNEHISRRVVILASISGITLAHTHYFGTMLVFLALFGVCFYRYRSRLPLKVHMLLLGICTIGFLPQMPLTIIDFREAGGGTEYIADYYMKWDILLIVLSRQLNGSLILAIFTLLGVFFVIFDEAKHHEHKNQRGWVVLGLWWGGCLGTALFISLVSNPVISPANMRIVMPATIIALGVITVNLMERFPEIRMNHVSLLIYSLFIVHLIFVHKVFAPTDPDIKEAFQEAGAHTTSGQRVVLIVNAQQLTWPDAMTCYYCDRIDGDIVDVIRYSGDFNDTQNRIVDSNASEIVFIHMTGWVIPMANEDILMIEGLGDVVQRSSHEKIETAIIRLS